MHAWRAALAFDGSRFLPDGATVLVDRGAIVGVEPAAYDVPAECPVTTYDGTLMPGLVDPHVHLVADATPGALERVSAMTDAEVDGVVEQTLRAQAAAGVTTVRDLGDRDYRTLAFRDRLAPGQSRIVASGPPVTVPGGHCHFLGCAAATPEELRSAVTEHAERGVDVVKVMASGGFLTPGTDLTAAQYTAEQLRVVVEAAHAMGLGVLAHAHSVTGITAALDAGVDGLEHVTGLTASGVHLDDALLDRVAAAGVTADPTLGNDLDVVAAMPPPPAHVVGVMQRLGLDFRSLQERRYRDVGRMREHGVAVVPGVDAGATPFKQHGNAWIAVTDLVVAGFPVAEALAAGTSGAAAACGLDGVTGSLRAGLAADLLVVDGDLRTDPAALGRPVAVAVRGEAVPTSAP